MRNTKMILDGITYLREIQKGSNTEEIAAFFDVSLEYVNECIVCAREHKDDAINHRPKVIVKEPRVVVLKDTYSGMMQIVESVEIELLRDIVARFDQYEVTEFQAVLPVKVKIKRKI